MSISFSAEQYNQEFIAKRLCMYEIPKNQLSKVGSTPAKNNVRYI
jgi:hypothetical protein